MDTYIYIYIHCERDILREIFLYIYIWYIYTHIQGVRLE